MSVPNGAYAVTAGAVGTVIIVALAARGNIGGTEYGLNTGLRIGGGKVGNNGEIKGLM